MKLHSKRTKKTTNIVFYIITIIHLTLIKIKINTSLNLTKQKITLRLSISYFLGYSLISTIQTCFRKVL